MSSPYIVILSDSENEYDDVPLNILLSDSDDEPSQSEPMEENEHPSSENPVMETEIPSEEEPMEVEPSEEEDPSEADPSEHEIENSSEESASETPIPSPPNHLPNNFSGAYTIHTARKRVAIPRRRTTSSSESDTPSTDPYIAPNATTHRRTDARRWTWLPETLQTWREDEGFPIITEEGESSTTGREYPLTREPPHHTVPLLVARMSTQESRIDHLEDAVEEMPGTEAYENLGGEVHTMGHHIEGLHDRVTSMEQHFQEVGEVTQEVAGRIQEFHNQSRSLESRMAWLEQNMTRMENHMDRLSAMAAASREVEAILIRGDHLPKKG